MTLERAIETLRKAGYRVLRPPCGRAEHELLRLRARRHRALRRFASGIGREALAAELAVDPGTLDRMLELARREELRGRSLDETLADVPLGVEWSVGSGYKLDKPWAYLAEPESEPGVGGHEVRTTGPNAVVALERAIVELRTREI